MNKILQWAGIVVAIVIAISGHGGFSAGNTTSSFSAASYFTATHATTDSTFAGGLTIGGGSSVSKFLFGTCTLTAYASLGATSTARLDCPATGVDSSFTNFRVTLPGASATGVQFFSVVGVSASSTTGYISAYLANWTGAATSSYAQATTSVMWEAWK